MICNSGNRLHEAETHARISNVCSLLGLAICLKVAGCFLRVVHARILIAHTMSSSSSSSSSSTSSVSSSFFLRFSLNKAYNQLQNNPLHPIANTQDLNFIYSNIVAILANILQNSSLSSPARTLHLFYAHACNSIKGMRHTVNQKKECVSGKWQIITLISMENTLNIGMPQKSSLQAITIIGYRRFLS